MRKKSGVKKPRITPFIFFAMFTGGKKILTMISVKKNKRFSLEKER
jgi:hypothetical protein